MWRRIKTGQVQIFAIAVVLQLWLPLGAQSQAGDLTEVFVRGFPPVGNLDVAKGVVPFAPAFANAVSHAVTQQFPLTSVSPAFSYRFNPALSVYERSTNVPGPLFGERSLTLGKGQLNVSVGYAFVDFTELNGVGLDSIKSPAFFQANDPDSAVASENPEGIPLLMPGETLVAAPLFFGQLGTRIDLQAHLVVPSLRYGITDDWDVGVALPIVNTSLRVRNVLTPVVDADFSRAHVLFGKNEQGQLRRLKTFTSGPTRTVPFGPTQRPPQIVKQSAGSATGIGDISLRTKYQFWSTETGGAALGLNLLLPTGEEEDFQGTDETHVSPFLYLSDVFMERVEPHLNVGVDLNANDVERSSVVWAAGLSVLVWEQLGIGIDFIGRSEFRRLDVAVPPEGFYRGGTFTKEPQACTNTDPCFVSGSKSFPFFPIKIERNDIIDCAFSVRYGIGQRGSIFFGILVPLNNDGFRADFIPAGGVEVSF